MLPLSTVEIVEAAKYAACGDMIKNKQHGGIIETKAEFYSLVSYYEGYISHRRDMESIPEPMEPEPDT